MTPILDSEQERVNFLKTRVESVSFPRRILDAMLKENIRTIAGIVKRSQAELKSLLKLSDREVEEVEKKIEELERSDANSSAPTLGTTLAESDQGKKASDALSLSDLGGADDIVATLSEYFGYKKETITSPGRTKRVVEVRDLIAYLLREYGAMSYPAIGRLLGGRDHTTIIYSYNKTKDKVAKNPELAHKLENLIGTVESIKQRKLRVEQDLIPEILAHTAGMSSQPSYKEIPERSRKILELWREGLTLQNIAGDFGVTRERIRQIIVATIKQMAVNESVSKGIVMDSNLLAQEEAKKRHSVREAKKISEHPEPVKKKKRWSRYYAACRSCGTTTIPHVRKGLCERCIGSFRSGRREHIITEHKNKCDSCGIGRYEAISAYGRDFYITKTQDVLCRKCFLSRTGTKLGNRIRSKR